MIGPNVSGDFLNQMKTDLTEWYFKTRNEMIEFLSQGTPYGARRITPDEQLDRFMQMTPQDYEALLVRLQNRYRGLPNSETLVSDALSKYLARMFGMMATRGIVGEEAAAADMEALQTEIFGGAM